MSLARILAAWTPPALAWRLRRAARERRQLESCAAFYRQFLAPGSLCFDVGANVGARTRCFEYLGCRVIAVEPQLKCHAVLERAFGAKPNVRIVKAAVGRNPGMATLHVSPDHVLSTLSTSFIERTSDSGRFAGSRWDRVEEVAMTTLDELIAEFGEPRFIKIDVEGYESEVMAGLSTAVPALSFEWVPELPDNARASVRQLAGLGDYEFNFSWGESMRFARPQWRSMESVLSVIDEFEGDGELFGDIYARLRSR